MKRILVFLILLMSFLGISVYADTTETTLSALNVQQIISYGKYKEYAPPLGYVSRESESIDTMGGSLSRVETDILLPGKNGLDLAITRKYNSQTTQRRFGLNGCFSQEFGLVGYEYKYSYTDVNSNTQYLYIIYCSEEEMLLKEDVNHSIKVLSNRMGVYNDNIYYCGQKNDYPLFSSSISSSFGDITATRDLLARPVVSHYKSDYTKIYDMDFPNKSVKIGYNWKLLIPHINSNPAFYYSEVTTNRYNAYWYGELVLGNGASYSIYNRANHEKNDDFLFSSGSISVEDAGKMFTFDFYNPIDNEVTSINNVSVYYNRIMSDKNGIKYYFDYYGYLTALVDKDGNAIYYYYKKSNGESNRITNVSLYDTTYYLDQIVDTLGRTVQFIYTDDHTVSEIQVKNGNNILNKITYETSVSNDDSVDQQNFYEYDNTYSLSVKKWENDLTEAPLVTVYNHAKRFIYYDECDDLKAKKFDFQSKVGFSQQCTIPDTVYLLTKIEYPTGMETLYEYGDGKENTNGEATEGGYQIKSLDNSKYGVTAYRAISRKDIIDNVLKNEYTYCYDLLPATKTGMGISYDNNCLTTKVADGLKTVDGYYSNYKLAEQIKTATDYYYKEKYWYDTPEEGYIKMSPVIVLTMKFYGRYGDSCYAECNKYDIKGNVIESAEGNYHDVDINNHTASEIIHFKSTNPVLIAYTYDPDYNMLLTKKYKVSDNKWYNLINTLDSSKKHVNEANEYETDDNDVRTLKSTTSYTYNRNGNTDIYTESSDNSHKMTTYTYYSDSTMQVESKATGLTDAEGNAVSDVASTISFDFFGNPVSVTDSNAKTTFYTYDLIGRKKGITYPDDTTVGYEYDSINNIIYVVDQGGRKEKIEYSSSGLMEKGYIDVSETGTPNYKEVVSYEYDALNRGSKVTTTSAYNVNGTPSEKKTVEYEFYPFDMVKSVTLKNIDGNIVDIQSYTYDMSSTSGEYVSDMNFISSFGNVYIDKKKSGTLINLVTDNSTKAFEKGISFYTDSDQAHIGVNVDKNYTNFFAKIDCSGYTSVFKVIANNSSNNPIVSYNETNDINDPYTIVDVNISGISKLYLKGYGISSLSNKKRDVNWADAVLLTDHDYRNGTGENYTKVTITRDAASGLTPPQVTQCYNRKGQLVKEITADGNDEYLTTCLYDKLGNLLEIRDPAFYKNNIGGENAGCTAKYEYDVLGNVVKEYNAAGDFKANDYDSLSRLTATSDFMGNNATITYDGLGRKIKVEMPFDNIGNSMVKSYYDGNGNVLSVKACNNAAGEAETFSEQTYAYDEMNRVTLASDGEGGYVQYLYDDLGNVKRVYTGLSGAIDTSLPYNPETDSYSLTKYDHNHLGNLETVTDPYGKEIKYTYDISGKVKTILDKAGNLKTNTYDSLSRLSNTLVIKDNVTNVAVYYNYDCFNNVTRMLDSSGSTFYWYDNLFRLQKETKYGKIKTYTYDKAGNRETFTFADGSNTLMSSSYAYDNLNRLTTYTSGSVTAGYTYNANGLLLTASRGGETAEYDYSPGSQVENITYKTGGTVNDVLSYSYYLDGNVKTYSSGNKVRNYAYDNAGRLTSEHVGATQDVYSYDLFGNRSDQVHVGTDGNYLVENAYNKNNQLTGSTKSFSEDKEHTAYYYDDNGNLISENTSRLSLNADGSADVDFYVTGTPDNSISTVFNTYDGFDRLTATHAVKSGSVTDASYTYDGSGLRQSKTVDGVTTTHLWDGTNIIADVGTSTTMFYRAMGLVASGTGSNIDFYRLNAHGDVIKHGVNTYDYDAFGNQMIENDNDTNPFRCCGEYFDGETGQIYLRARYYDASTARFISEDSNKGDIRNPLSLNLYTYCYNNPIRYIDPSGHVVTEEDKQNLSADNITLMEQYTTDWETANKNGDKQGMIAAHAKAEMLRDTYRGGGSLTINSANGHSWMTYKSSQGETFTFGTWGNKGRDNTKRVLFNLEKDALYKNPNTFGEYVSKTVSINGDQVGSLLGNINSMNKDEAWTATKNCAFFAANAWSDAGQLNLKYNSDAGYSDPAILRVSIGCSYRNYRSHGNGPIDAQTDSSSSSNSGSGSSTKGSADSIYWTSSY